MSERRAVYNDQGFMTFVTQEYAARGLERGELQESEEGHLVVVPQPVRQFTPEEKRRMQLAKEREAKSNR